MTELEIECDYIAEAKSSQHYRKVVVKLAYPEMSFIKELEGADVAEHIEAPELLQAIADTYGVEYIANWLKELGN